VNGSDFVTAPKVSNIFDECLGFWFAAVWDDAQQSGAATAAAARQGAWQLVKCGPRFAATYTATLDIATGTQQV
jgi:hypothetical protein